MNRELSDAIKLYSTKSHKELNLFLLEKSKDNLISMFNGLLTIYINDKNSSMLREYITTSIAGYIHHTKKLGYNGYRQVGIGDGGEYCEVKPRNVNKNNEKIKNKKLNGDGNFTDYTWDRFDRDFKTNLNMLISGFVDGKLIYIIEFPFKNKDFCNKLRTQLEKKFPNKTRNEGNYLRSCNFSFKDYMYSNNFKIKFLVKKSELKEFECCINCKFYNELVKYAE